MRSTLHGGEQHGEEDGFNVEYMVSTSTLHGVESSMGGEDGFNVERMVSTSTLHGGEQHGEDGFNVEHMVSSAEHMVIPVM